MNSSFVIISPTGGKTKGERQPVKRICSERVETKIKREGDMKSRHRGGKDNGRPTDKASSVGCDSAFQCTQTYSLIWRKGFVVKEFVLNTLAKRTKDTNLNSGN